MKEIQLPAVRVQAGDTIRLGEWLTVPVLSTRPGPDDHIVFAIDHEVGAISVPRLGNVTVLFDDSEPRRKERDFQPRLPPPGHPRHEVARER